MEAVGFVAVMAVQVGISWLLLHDFVQRSVQLWWRITLVVLLVPGSLIVWAVMNRRGEDPFSDVSIGTSSDGSGRDQLKDAR